MSLLSERLNYMEVGGFLFTHPRYAPHPVDSVGYGILSLEHDFSCRFLLLHASASIRLGSIPDRR